MAQTQKSLDGIIERSRNLRQLNLNGTNLSQLTLQLQTLRHLTMLRLGKY